MINELWTPQGSVPLGAAPVGHNAETGNGIVKYSVLLKAKDKFGVEHKQRIDILADEADSQAHVEDMMAQAAETFLEEVKTKHQKRAPTQEERKEIGKALNDFRSYALRRRESTNKKIYYQVRK
ncbi:MAG: hypothetical protein KAJ19_18420 [Gammaproteobacteria bacterium]|nr:hypothetical protein [Gammaproteobacteria bacterium]